MINDFTWTDAVMFASLVALGSLVKFGWLKFHGRRTVMPYIDRSAASITVLVVVMSVMSFVTVIQNQAREQSSTACDVQFRDALTYNASLNIVEKNLRDERDAAFDVLLSQIAANVGKPAAQARIDNGAAIVEYRTTVRSIDQRRDESVSRRSAYPDPTCGRRE